MKTFKLVKMYAWTLNHVGKAFFVRPGDTCTSFQIGIYLLLLSEQNSAMVTERYRAYSGSGTDSLTVSLTL